ncbi:MAG: hypothetical protein ACO1Q7_12555 [Gemmatimonas sp.]
MKNTAGKLAAAATFALTLLPFATMDAQVTEVARTPIADLSRLTFGYFCDDKFVVRNDGDQPVNVEYAVEKGTEHTRLQLNAHELVELESKGKGALELWMDGKLVARAPKEKRNCKDVQGNGAVTITPFEVADNSNNNRRSNPWAVGAGFGWAPYGLYDPGGMSFYSRFGAWGRSPYYSTIVRVPVIVGRGGGGRGRR